MGSLGSWQTPHKGEHPQRINVQGSKVTMVYERLGQIRRGRCGYVFDQIR